MSKKSVLKFTLIAVVFWTIAMILNHKLLIRYFPVVALNRNDVVISLITIVLLVVGLILNHSYKMVNVLSIFLGVVLAIGYMIFTYQKNVRLYQIYNENYPLFHIIRDIRCSMVNGLLIILLMVNLFIIFKPKHEN